MDAITINTYNKCAREYDQETTDFWDEFPINIINVFTQQVSGRILDIGSGPGRDGLILKQAGLDVVCLDASEEMINISTEKGLESALGDFAELPFEDNSFDGAWAYTSLLHVPKSQINDALSEIYRVLKPGGTFGLGMIEGSDELYRESSGVREPRWFSFYTQDELEKLTEKAGFKILYFEKFKPHSRNYLNYILIKK